METPNSNNEFLFDLESCPIEIRIITINGKRITRSFYNELEYAPCFKSKFEFVGERILGYVNEKSSRDNDPVKVLVWFSKNQVKRTKLKSYDYSDMFIEEVVDIQTQFLTEEDLKIAKEERQKCFYFQDDLTLFQIAKFRLFLEALEGRQIYFI